MLLGNSNIGTTKAVKSDYFLLHVSSLTLDRRAQQEGLKSFKVDRQSGTIIETTLWQFRTDQHLDEPQT